ncbi:DUF481 domain-containing protein [Ilyomonas limi]|uniref:DUF481 domain-containing protein n=1 Tax=Ilyomonas limi TaxID=2575867 RepID=A0A4U3L8M7_9BACT|nr:DUF481 domain-containing protein [Ilyomonas limi]TKK70266.1 DUF481 domain-containing protein [Ilyomonas limi]
MNIFTTILILCLCIIPFLPASAQFNDSINYHLRFATTGSLNKTNAGDAYLLNNGVGFNINKRKITLNTNASWVYGQLNKTLTNNDFAATTDMDFLKKVSKLYYWGLLNFESSYSLKTKYRFQPGAGVGYRFIDTTNAVFTVSDGILFEMADLTNATFGKEKYQTVRNSLRVKYHFLIGKVITIEGVNFWQPSLLSFKDYIFKFNNSLSFKLNEWLSLTSALSYNKISRSGSENLLFTFGITLDKYF